jgi:CelD/BcsL family acetyltransferase involved in cellulose biosynthesis
MPVTYASRPQSVAAKTGKKYVKPDHSVLDEMPVSDAIGGAACEFRVLGRAHMPELRVDWNRLSSMMAYPTPFATWEWADAWARTAGRGRAVHVIVAVADGQVIALLPLAVRSGPRGVTTLTMLGAEFVYPDHLALICKASTAPALLAPMLRAAFAATGSGTRIDLPFVAADSEMGAACRALSAQLPTRHRSVALAPFLPIAGTHADFLGGLSGNERYKIRNRTKKLLVNLGARYDSPIDLATETVLRRLRELHASRAAEKGIESSFDLDVIQEFHHALLGQLPREQIMFRCLRSGDDIFAVFYGFLMGGRVFYFQLGYDPAWADHSPGIVLLSEVIREAHELGTAEFNFLQGDETFKRTWTKQQRVLEDWSFYCPGPAGRTRQAIEAGVVSAKRHARRLLAHVARREERTGKV